MHGKENDNLGVAASLVGNVGSSYVARLQRRQELDKLRESVAGKSVSERLMRKSMALRPAKGNSAISGHQPQHQGSLLSTAPQSPLTSLAASEALLDDAAEKLQRELDGYDQKLQALRSHAGSLPAIPLAPNAAALKASIAAAIGKPERQSPMPVPPPPPAAPASTEQPIVRSVITATGQGCKEVLAASAKAASMGTRRKTGSAASAAATWKTRAHKAPRTQSSCMLQLAAKRYRDVAIRITFADAITVPALLCFEHAPTPTAPFVLLGQVPLQPKSTKQLKHVFRLGADTTVEKCLRITCLGHIAKKHSGVHSVSHLLITGEVAPSSPPPVAPTVSFTSSGSTVKQVLGGAEQEGEEVEMATSAPVDAVEFHNVSLDAGKPTAKEANVAVKGDNNKKKKGDVIAEKNVENAKKKKAAPPPPPPLPPAVAAAPVLSSKSAAAPPPPPPPPPAPSAASGARLPPGKVGPAPSRPTLKLFWDKVQPRESIIQKTVWGQLPESSENTNLEIDFAQLEEEFAAKAPAVDLNSILSAKNNSAAGNGARGGLRGTGSLLVTIQRANNVGAMLARLKLTPEQAKRALLRLVGDEEEETEDRGLDLEELESILPCLPTDEERQILAKYEGKWEGLTPCERFMLSVLPVPALQARLQAIVFLHSFDSRAAAVGEAAGSVTAACTEVRESALLRFILKTALVIGNFLNAGNRAGSAAGFQVDALLKLRDIKSSTTSRSRTLLHFLAREVSKQHPNCYSLTSELPTCRVASRISLGDLRAELDALAEGIEAAHRAGRDGGADPAHLDELLAVATERLVGVNGTVVEADAAFMELRSFLNSKPSTMEEPAPFFSLLTTFCAQLDSAHAENAAVDATTRPSSAPPGINADVSQQKQALQLRHSMGTTSFAPLGTAAADNASTQNQEIAVAAAATSASPVQSRDQVLSSIRAYSRLTDSQRKALLTDQGAKERIASLGITHRHSVAAPTGLADVYKNKSIGDIFTGIRSDEESHRAATAMRISAPAISLAAMLASATAITEPKEKEEELVQEEAATTEVMEGTIQTEEQLYNEEEQEVDQTGMEATSSSVSNSNSEIEDKIENQGVATGVLSSPVARMLSSSRNLVESVALRCSTLSTQQEEKKEEEPCSDDHVAHAEDESINDVSAIDSDEPDAMVSSPVTLRPLLNASVDVAASLQATPQVAWAKKTVGGGSNSGDDVDDNSTTPEGSVLPCSASLQPVPAENTAAHNGERVWRSSVAALDAPTEAEEEEERVEQRSPDAVGDDVIHASSFACLSHENPMVSAPTSLHFGYNGTASEYQYDRALEDDAGSPEKPTRPRRSAGGGGAAIRESFEEEGEEKELCCSTQWVQHATAAASAAAPAGVRGSKRVSFSLPNSPRGSSSGDAEDEYEAAPSPFIDAHNQVVEQQQHHQMQMQQPVEELQQQQQLQESQLSHGSVQSRKPQRVSIPGLDLDLAKQLVKNASQVQKSRERRSYSTQQPSGMQQQQQHWGGGESSAGREVTPTPFVVDSGALTPTNTATAHELYNALPSPGGSSVAPSIQEQAAHVLSKALAAEMRRSLPGLPGVPSDTLPAFPLTLSPVNLDQIMAAIISNAGNTPTGPLARGARQGDAHLFDDAAIEVLRAAAAQRLAAAEQAQPGQEHKALLEPIVPAPLGMGVRVSETVAHGISPSTLRNSLEAHLRLVQQTSSQTQNYHAASRAHTTAAHNRGNGSGSDVHRPTAVSMMTAAQGPTPAVSYREEEEEQQQYHQQQQQGVSYNTNNGSYAYGTSYATSADRSRMNASGTVRGDGYQSGNYGAALAGSANYSEGGLNSGGGSASQVSNMNLSGMRQSVPKSGSVRDVHSSLAQERIARWNGTAGGY